MSETSLTLRPPGDPVVSQMAPTLESADMSGLGASISLLSSKSTSKPKPRFAEFTCSYHEVRPQPSGCDFSQMTRFSVMRWPLQTQSFLVRFGDVIITTRESANVGWRKPQVVN